jgi:DNA-binding CsgD family transcriptional regulator
MSHGIDSAAAWHRARSAVHHAWNAAGGTLQHAPWRRIGLGRLADHPGASAALAHGGALLMASTLIVIQPFDSPARWSTLGPALVAIGLSSLRVASARRSLAPSTLLLDGAGTALLVTATGAPGSPFYFLALAGAWWASCLPSRTGFAYAGSFAVTYAVLVVPSALRDGALTLAVEESLIVLLVAALARRLAARTGEAHDAEATTSGGSRLTTLQSELLAYLVQGLTNREIADRTKTTEGLVRSRLTALYRVLGVRGRREARLRGHQFGVDRAS